MKQNDTTNVLGAPLDRTRDALDRIQTALRGLRFGTVTAVVKDGVVVQVDRTEKIRLEAPSRRSRIS